MLSYTQNQIDTYKKNFSQTEKKLCKSKITELLEVNGERRTPNAIGQWFIKPSQVPDFSRLTKETILLSMYNAVLMVDYYHKKQEEKTDINFFAKFFNI